jgi:hypothetical protein
LKAKHIHPPFLVYQIFLAKYLCLGFWALLISEWQKSFEQTLMQIKKEKFFVAAYSALRPSC